VSDNGPGMDRETVTRATDPFFTTKDKNSGTGLGLAMVYGFAQQADGALKIYSEPGIGTSVQLTLPRGSTSGLRVPNQPQETLVPGKGERLLVVEDEPDLLQAMTELLQELNYEVLAATSGVEALKQVEHGLEFDLLLTDVVMPGGIGGFELARRVRALRPELPMVYMSGYTGFTAPEMGSVAAPILQKPANPGSLAQVLRKALEQEPRLEVEPT